MVLSRNARGVSVHMMKYTIAIIFMLVLSAASPAQADCNLSGSAVCDGVSCSGAAKPEGTIIYNADAQVFQGCEGTEWVPLRTTLLDAQMAGSGYCNQIGNVCSADGTVYIGNSPLDGQPLYATRCDHGRTWNGLKCAGDPTRECWDDCSDTVVTGITGATDGFDGHFNTAALVNMDAGSAGGFQNHIAPKLCRDLTMHGYSDWYMPAPNEMQLIRDAHTLVGDIDRSG